MAYIISPLLRKRLISNQFPPSFGLNRERAERFSRKTITITLNTIV